MQRIQKYICNIKRFNGTSYCIDDVYFCDGIVKGFYRQKKKRSSGGVVSALLDGNLANESAALGFKPTRLILPELNTVKQSHPSVSQLESSDRF